MYYKILDTLPKIPNDIEKDILALAKNNDLFLENSIRTKKMYNIPEKDDQIQTFPKINLSNTKIGDWLKINIHAKAKFYQLTKNISFGKSFWPHVDRGRKFNLIYLIQTGGNCNTVFYRTKDNSQIYPSQIWPNYENLVEVDRIKISINTWTLLRVDVPHSVEDLIDCRISVQLSFD